jgi:hypothetical protein
VSRVIPPCAGTFQPPGFRTLSTEADTPATKATQSASKTPAPVNSHDTRRPKVAGDHFRIRPDPPENGQSQNLMDHYEEQSAAPTLHWLRVHIHQSVCYDPHAVSHR